MSYIVYKPSSIITKYPARILNHGYSNLSTNILKSFDIFRLFHDYYSYQNSTMLLFISLPWNTLTFTKHGKNQIFPSYFRQFKIIVKAAKRICPLNPLHVEKLLISAVLESFADGK